MQLKTNLSALALFAVFSLGTTAVRAEDHAKVGPHFEEHKQAMIQNIDARIQNLTTAKACFSAAKDHDAMKACHQALEASQKAAMEQMHAMHEAHKEEHEHKGDKK